MRGRLLTAENRRHWTLAALILAAFSFGLQQTMVLPALTSLRQDLHTTPTWAAWIFTGFLLSSAVLTPLMGSSATSTERAGCWRSASRSSLPAASAPPEPGASGR
jgi:predicted MFS family arabinose efflux permease